MDDGDRVRSSAESRPIFKKGRGAEAKKESAGRANLKKNFSCSGFPPSPIWQFPLSKLLPGVKLGVYTGRQRQGGYQLTQSVRSHPSQGMPLRPAPPQHACLGRRGDREMEVLEILSGDVSVSERVEATDGVWGCHAIERTGSISGMR